MDRLRELFWRLLQIIRALYRIHRVRPAKEYLTAAVSNVSTEFRRSGAYSRLPNTIDEAEKAKKKQTKNPFKESDEKDMDTEDDFDLTGWSPLQEVLDAMPTFSAEA